LKAVDLRVDQLELLVHIIDSGTRCMRGIQQRPAMFDPIERDWVISAGTKVR